MYKIEEWRENKVGMRPVKMQHNVRYILNRIILFNFKRLLVE